MLPHMLFGVHRDSFIRKPAAMTNVACSFCIPSICCASNMAGDASWEFTKQSDSFLPSPWTEVLVLKISSVYEFTCIFFNGKGYCNVYKRAPPVPVISQMNPFHLFPASFSDELYYYYCSSTPWCSRQSLVRQVCPTKTLCVLSSLSCLVRLIVVDMVALIMFSEKCKPRSFHNASSIPLSGSNITLFSDFFSL